MGNTVSSVAMHLDASAQKGHVSFPLTAHWPEPRGPVQLMYSLLRAQREGKLDIGAS